MADMPDEVVQRLDWILQKLDLILKKLPGDPDNRVLLAKLDAIEKAISKR